MKAPEESRSGFPPVDAMLRYLGSVFYNYWPLPPIRANAAIRLCFQLAGAGIVTVVAS